MTAYYEGTMDWFCGDTRRVAALFWFTCLYGLVRAEAIHGWPVVKFLTGY